MRNLWRRAATAAIVSGALGACASPHYPIRADQTPGPAPLSAPKPNYPVTAPPPSDNAAAPAETPAPPPTAAPVAPVQSQPLPPAAPSPSSDAAPAAPSNAAPAAAAADSPPAAAPAVMSTASSSTPAPTPAVLTAVSTPAPAAAASPPPAAEPALAPQAVTHDQTTSSAAPAPTYREASAEAPVRRAGPRYAIAGEVIDARGEVFENYEVQKGDHIDALARAFDTSRTVILDANHIRAPYVIHPGQILKVPVAKAYVAESGDTLSGVARRFGVEAAELASLNHISERGALRPGERIGLPSSMHDRGPLRVLDSESAYATYAPPRREDRAPPEPLYAPPQRAALASMTQTPMLTPDRGSNYQALPQTSQAAQAASGPSDAEVAAAAHGRFMWPVRGDIVARFGPTGIGRRNDGVDIKAAQGSVVAAAAPGEVVYAGDQVPGYGNLVLIKHADGWVTAYAHLDAVSVQMKQQVTQGQALGSVGMTGGVSEPELHFEVRYAPTPADKAKPVDPVLVLPTG